MEHGAWLNVKSIATGLAVQRHMSTHSPFYCPGLFPNSWDRIGRRRSRLKIHDLADQPRCGRFVHKAMSGETSNRVLLPGALKMNDKLLIFIKRVDALAREYDLDIPSMADLLLLYNSQKESTENATAGAYDSPDDYMSREEAARLLGYSEDTIDNLRRDNIIKSHKLNPARGGRVRILRRSVLALLKTKTEENKNINDQKTIRGN